MIAKRWFNKNIIIRIIIIIYILNKILLTLSKFIINFYKLVFIYIIYQNLR